MVQKRSIKSVQNFCKKCPRIVQKWTKIHFVSIIETEEIVDVARSLELASEVGATHWSKKVRILSYNCPNIVQKLSKKSVQKWTKIRFASIAETEAQQIDPK